MKIVKENLRKLILEMEKELEKTICTCDDKNCRLHFWTDKLLEAIEDVNE